MTDVRALTSDYEQWLRTQIPVDDTELDRKHHEMAADEFRFFRGTYYLWLVRVAKHLPDVLGSSVVPIVGDLHVENFGTWRDRDQFRRWGVNDLDELSRGAWQLDLLRLAVSAVLTPRIALDEHAICTEVLGAWRAAVPRAALDLDEDGAGHLRHLVPSHAPVEAFYADLSKGPEVRVPHAVEAAAVRVAEPGWMPTWHAHVAGTGSLGHLRAAGVGPASDGTLHAREAKQLGPGSCVWAATKASHLPTFDETLYPSVVRAVRGPAGATRVDDWQVRDLAPDVVRIDLAGLHPHDAGRLLRAMARAAADVHGSDAHAFAVAQGEVWDVADFAAAVRTMVEVTRADWAEFSRPGGGRSP